MAYNTYTGRRYGSTESCSRLHIYLWYTDGRSPYYMNDIKMVTDYLYGRDHNLIVRWVLLPYCTGIRFTISHADSELEEFGFDLDKPIDIITELNSVSSDEDFVFGLTPDRITTEPDDIDVESFFDGSEESKGSEGVAETETLLKLGRDIAQYMEEKGISLKS